MADTDISRVVSLIMENPKLIEEIKGLVERDSGAESQVAEKAPEPIPERREAPIEISSPELRHKKRRQDLLSALKPYISDERRKAVESFVTIADILDMMREK